MENIYFSSKNYSQFKKIVKGVLCFCEHIPEKNPDDPTKILVQKVSLLEMRNEVLNTVVHQSIDKHLIKEEKGMKLNFKGILLSVKIILGMNWNCLMVTVKKTSTMHKLDWRKPSLHIQTYYMIV